MAKRRKPQYGVGRNGKRMSPAQLRALKKAQAASARKRRKGGSRSSKARRNRRIKTGLAVVGGLVIANRVGGRALRGAKRTRVAYKNAKVGTRGTRY